MTNRNTTSNYTDHWKTQVHVPNGPDQMSYRGDFCCGEYATVVVKDYGTTEGSNPDAHIQAGEIVTIDYDYALPQFTWNVQTEPYQPGAAESTLTARPTRTPWILTTTPKIEYITQHPTTGYPNPVGVVLVDPFPVDPQNVDGNGPAGNDVWITHIALRGFCLVKDRRRMNTAHHMSRYKPGRLVTIDAQAQTFPNPPNKRNGYAVYCMVNILDENRQTVQHAESAIGTYHRVISWGGTNRDSGYRAGFPGDDTGYGGQDILLIYLSGTNDTGYAL